jgi:tetratricopeptide (TPR) repeat protein
LVVVLASYLPVLGAPLIWDDQHLIERTPLVQTLHPLSEYFTQGFWQADDLAQGRIYYRPLTVLSLALDHAAHGNSPAGFHLTNLVVHLFSTALLFCLLRVRGSAGYAAALGAALWALQPRLTEAVAWISGRTDVWATFFVLCALLSQARAGRASRVWCAGFLLLGLMCKEVALAGVAAVLVAEFAAAGAVSARLRRMIPCACAVVVYLALRASATGLAPGQTSSHHGHFLPATAALGHYLAMLVTPWFPNLQIGRLSEPSTGYSLLGCALLLACTAGFALRGARLRKESLAPLALTVVGFAAVLHLVPINLNVVAADRFLYLPLVGLILLLLPTLEKTAPLAAGACALLAVSFAVATFLRSNTWSDEAELWTVTYEANPDNQATACVELGRLYAKVGLLAHAFSIDEGCSDTSNRRRILINNAAGVLARSGRFNAAIELILALPPALRREAVFNLNLALFRSYLGDFAAARADLARCLAIDPGYVDALELAKKLPELERERERALALPASTPKAEQARSLAKVGLTVQALSAWRDGLASPDATREQFEEGLWFALAQGDPSTVEDFHRRYRLRFADAGNPQLELAYEAQRDLAQRLLDAWPRLGLSLRALPS